MGDELVVVGFAGAPHGVHGAVRVRATGPTLHGLAPGTRLVARCRDGAERTLTLAGSSGAPPRLILRLVGVASRADAALITGADLLVEPAALPKITEPDTVYVRDLVGCQVHAGERPLGPVTAVHPGPANDALEVATVAGAVLVPFTADAVTELDVPAGRIVIRPDLLPGP